MTAKPQKFNHVAIFIKPYQKEITLYMALHAILKLTGKHMRLKVIG